MKGHGLKTIFVKMCLNHIEGREKKHRGNKEEKNNSKKKKERESGISKFITFMLDRRWGGTYRAIISIANCYLQ